MHGHISIDRLWWYDLTGVLDICLSISIRIRIFRWGKDSKEKLTWILWTKHMTPSTIEMYNRILCYSYTFLSWIIISPSSSFPLVSVFFKHNITKYLKMSIDFVYYLNRIELWTWNRGDCQGIAIKELWFLSESKWILNMEQGRLYRNYIKRNDVKTDTRKTDVISTIRYIYVEYEWYDILSTFETSFILEVNTVVYIIPPPTADKTKCFCK